MHLIVAYGENKSWTTKKMDRDGKRCCELLWMTGTIMLKQ